ncbi:MAG TPA: hypothetical protein ENK56_02890 [Chloroflexi bacterium]|nr:hypothetical protein [Chloroflexota bacterium]
MSISPWGRVAWAPTSPWRADKRQSKNNRRNIENHAYNFNEIQSNLFVNLRCMQIKDNTINIYVGGGITKDSNPEKEFLETVAKAKVMKRILVFSN